MAERTGSNLSRERLHSRRLANNPHVRQATRANKKPRKQAPTVQPANVQAPNQLTATASQTKNRKMQQDDRMERLREPSKAQAEQPPAAPAQLQAAPKPFPFKENLPSMDSFSPEIAQKIKTMIFIGAFQEAMQGGSQ
jgi:hypothetical protein